MTDLAKFIKTDPEINPSLVHGSAKVVPTDPAELSAYLRHHGIAAAAAPVFNCRR